MTLTTSRDEKQARLKDVCGRLLANRRLVLVSNRGPVEHRRGPDGTIGVRRGSGGVVTALNSLTKTVEFSWVASAMGEGDRTVSREGDGGRIKSPLPGHQIYVRYVVTPRRVYHKYYNVFCNPLLWFLQHYMWNSPYNPNIDANVMDAWRDGYLTANKAFAEAAIKEVGGGRETPIVMLHDYHLYMAPKYVREALSEALITIFVHIPWPSSRYWQLIPSSIRKEIWESLCATDIIGFQSLADVRSFLNTCENFLPDAEVDPVTRTVYYNGHKTVAKAYPISIDPEEVRRIGNSRRALEYERQIAPLCTENTVVRVDRAEPSKNVVRGFRAYRDLLEGHPELHGKVNFLAFLVPSRTHIRQYKRYLSEIETVVGEINIHFGSADWQPVTVFYENNYTQAIAGMKQYDVLLVNPVIDGMNLVAKEGPIVNTKNGVLVLSETTGAYHQLCEGALGVSPADVKGTTEALYESLTMSGEERERRARLMTESIETEDIAHWICRQLEDIEAIAQES
jgi:trehalose 6-phosphate synthase